MLNHIFFKLVLWNFNKHVQHYTFFPVSSADIAQEGFYQYFQMAGFDTRILLIPMKLIGCKVNQLFLSFDLHG